MYMREYIFYFWHKVKSLVKKSNENMYNFFVKILNAFFLFPKLLTTIMIMMGMMKMMMTLMLTVMLTMMTLMLLTTQTKYQQHD